MGTPPISNRASLVGIWFVFSSQSKYIVNIFCRSSYECQTIFVSLVDIKGKLNSPYSSMVAVLFLFSYIVQISLRSLTLGCSKVEVDHCMGPLNQS